MNIGELIAYIKVNNKDAVKGMKEVHSGLMFLDRSILDVRGPLEQFFSISNLPLMVQGIDAIWQLSGAMGVIPAVAGAGTLAMGAFKLALSGVSDAMGSIRDQKAFDEAIKDMPKNMQDAMRSIQKLVPEWDKLKSRVQDAAWTNINTHIDLLGRRYLPILNTGLFKTAMGMNRGATAAAQFLEETQQSDDVAHSFDNMSVFVEKLAAQFPNLIAFFLDFVTIGSDQLPTLADWISQLIERFTAFIQRARESGQLGQWMQRGIESLKMLGQIAFNIGAILVNAFKASDQEGAGLLQTLLNLTTNMLNWVKSAEGQEKIRALFEALQHVAFPLLTLIPMVTSAVFALAQIFNALPGPVQSVIGFMIGWGGILSFVGVKVWTIIGVLKAFKWETIATVVTAVAQWSLMALTVAAKGAAMIVSLTATAVAYVAQWTLMAAGAMSRAAVMAAAWVVALGPIAWVIAAIVGLAALIIWKWDTIKNATIASWNFITGVISRNKDEIIAVVTTLGRVILAIMTGGLSEIVIAVVRNWDAIKQKFRDGVNAIINFVRELPGKIVGFIADLPNQLYQIGVRAIQSLINGILSMLGPVGSAIRAVAGTISGGLPHSPAQYGPLSGSGSPDVVGERIGQMLAEGIRRSLGEVSNATIDITRQVNPLTGFISSFLDQLPIKREIIDGLQEALSSIKLEINGAGVAKIVNEGNMFNGRRL